jgi:hypothetical protein
MISTDIYFEIEQEIKQTPPQYLPALLNIIHAFREGVCFDKLNNPILPIENKAQTPFDDLFGMIKTTRTVSLEEMEQAISEQGLERFNDCH